MQLETNRLSPREMPQADYPALCRILRDPLAMYAYEHAFSGKKVQAWLDRQPERYARYGFGLWAVIEKETGQLIVQCGLTMQDWSGREVPPGKQPPLPAGGPAQRHVRGRGIHQALLRHGHASPGLCRRKNR